MKLKFPYISSSLGKLVGPNFIKESLTAAINSSLKEFPLK